MPKISVIIPTYNSAKYIAQAIESVLAQTYSDYEIIVVDDGSTDDTVAVLRPYLDRITYIYQDNKKLPAARNAGIAASSGAYLAFLDSDDLFLPDKLAVQTRCLDERPDVGLVASGYQYVDEAGQLLAESQSWVDRPAITLESLLFGGLTPPVAVLLRREWFDRVDGFDEQFAYCEDMDLWYRLALAGCPMVWEPAIVCQYRLHANNMSRSPETHFRYHRRALDKAFADPLMPEGLQRQRARTYAQLDMSEAARLTAGGWEDAARERVRRAVATDPGLAAENGRGLAEIAVALRSSVWSDGRFPEFVTAVVGAEIPAIEQTIATVSAQKRFYTAFSDHQAAEVRRAWLEVARHDPRWLLNRGGWSILRQSLSSGWSTLEKPGPEAASIEKSRSMLFEREAE
jgi:GT2 family glycosyltransferase